MLIPGLPSLPSIDQQQPRLFGCTAVCCVSSPKLLGSIALGCLLVLLSRVTVYLTASLVQDMQPIAGAASPPDLSLAAAAAVHASAGRLLNCKAMLGNDVRRFSVSRTVLLQELRLKLADLYVLEPDGFT